jgi:hypothetical protein
LGVENFYFDVFGIGVGLGGVDKGCVGRVEVGRCAHYEGAEGQVVEDFAAVSGEIVRRNQSE